MDYYEFDVRTVRLPQFAQAPAVAQATWLKVLCYCVHHENGGILPGAESWTEAAWVSIVGVTRRDVHKSSPLLEFRDGTLHVWGFPSETLKKVEATRQKRSAAANARWRDHNALKQTASNGDALASILDMQTPSNSNAEERRGEERRGEHTAGASASLPENLTALEREIHRTLPESLASLPDFRTQWAEWVGYVAARQRPGGLPPTQTFDAHLRTLATCVTLGGAPLVAESLRIAIARNLREPLAPEKIVLSDGPRSGSPSSSSAFTQTLPPGVDPHEGGAYPQT